MVSSGLLPTGGHFLEATGFGLGAGFEAGPPFSNFDIRSLILVDEVRLLNIPPPSSSSGELRFSKLGGSGETILSGDAGCSDLNEGVGLTGRKGGGSSFFISDTGGFMKGLCDSPGECWNFGGGIGEVGLGGREGWEVGGNSFGGSLGGRLVGVGSTFGGSLGAGNGDPGFGGRLGGSRSSLGGIFGGRFEGRGSSGISGGDLNPGRVGGSGWLEDPPCTFFLAWLNLSLRYEGICCLVISLSLSTSALAGRGGLVGG